MCLRRVAIAERTVTNLLSRYEELLTLHLTDPEQVRARFAAVFPEVPHQLCQYHYLRETAKPIYEADRHAKTELIPPLARLL
jgi:hypothetical protein